MELKKEGGHRGARPPRPMRMGKSYIFKKTGGRPPTYGPEHIIYLNCGLKKNRIVPGAQVTTIITDKPRQ